MIAWVVGVPVFLMLMVLALDKLEATVVAPIERTVKIRRLVDSAPAEQLEREIAIMLAPALEGIAHPNRGALRSVVH